MKHFIGLFTTILIVLLLAACADETRSVNVFDKDLHEKRVTRFEELDDYFEVTYNEENDNILERRNDPLFEEYERLLYPYG